MRMIQARNGKINLTATQFESIRRYYAFARSLTPGHMLGKKHTTKTRHKIKSNVRDENGNSKNKGKVAWNKGITMSEEWHKAREGKLVSTWKENWNSPIREENRLKAICKQVSINGIVYTSAKEAARQLGDIKYSALIKRIESKNYPSYYWTQPR